MFRLRRKSWKESEPQIKKSLDDSEDNTEYTLQSLMAEPVKQQNEQQAADNEISRFKAAAKTKSRSDMWS